MDRREFSEERKKNLSESHKGLKYPDRKSPTVGNMSQCKERSKKSKSQQKRVDEGRCPLTIDGKGHERRKERNELMGKVEYKIWRDGVLYRDGHSCVQCGRNNMQLHADHIKPWVDYLELRYDINNDRTLCVECHRKTDTYGMKNRRKSN